MPRALDKIISFTRVLDLVITLSFAFLYFCDFTYNVPHGTILFPRRRSGNNSAVWSDSSEARHYPPGRMLPTRSGAAAGSFHRQVPLVTIPSTPRRGARCVFSRVASPRHLSPPSPLSLGRRCTRQDMAVRKAPGSKETLLPLLG